MMWLCCISLMRRTVHDNSASPNTATAELTGEQDKNSAMDSWRDYSIAAPIERNYDRTVHKLAFECLHTLFLEKHLFWKLYVLCIRQGVCIRMEFCEKLKVHSHFQRGFVITLDYLSESVLRVRLVCTKWNGEECCLPLVSIVKIQ